MKFRILILALGLMTVATMAQKVANFSGSWQFNPEKSKNVGMMGQMKMVLTITQTDSSLDITTRSTYQGRDDDSKLHYDLTGKPVTNELPMGDPSETVSKWEGARLVTTWTSESAVAGGPKVVRTETRSLSPDGKTMTVELVRGSNPSLVMVFEKK
ncbi:MAG TPA: hypothetical protein VE994_09160 [Terriglobales bacterium]|jgi:hypothetical protein|nr:hypothetical protein [Terriglobales bacterium]